MISKQRLTCCFCAAYVLPCLFKATDLEAICIVVHSIHYARFTHGSSGQKCYFRKWNNLLETKAKTYFCLMHSMTFSFPALSLFLSLAAPVFLVFISVFLTVPLKHSYALTHGLKHLSIYSACILSSLSGTGVFEPAV